MNRFNDRQSFLLERVASVKCETEKENLGKIHFKTQMKAEDYLICGVVNNNVCVSEWERVTETETEIRAILENALN